MGSEYERGRREALEEAGRICAAETERAKAYARREHGEERQIALAEANGMAVCTSLVRRLMSSDVVNKKPLKGSSDHTALWDAIAEYVAACGGRTDTVSGPRMSAVSKVEAALRVLVARGPEGL